MLIAIDDKCHKKALMLRIIMLNVVVVIVVAPWPNGKEATVNRALDGSTYTG
jgi:hypothetical protein